MYQSIQIGVMRYETDITMRYALCIISARNHINIGEYQLLQPIFSKYRCIGRNGKKMANKIRKNRTET